MVVQVLEGDLSIDAFEEWLVEHTWDDRTDLVADIDLVLAEKEHLDAAGITEGLRRAISTIWMEAQPTAPGVTIAFGVADRDVVVRDVDLTSAPTIRRQLTFAGK